MIIFFWVSTKYWDLVLASLTGCVAISTRQIHHLKLFHSRLLHHTYLDIACVTFDIPGLDFATLQFCLFCLLLKIEIFDVEIAEKFESENKLDRYIHSSIDRGEEGKASLETAIIPSLYTQISTLSSLTS